MQAKTNMDLRRSELHLLIIALEPDQAREKQYHIPALIHNRRTTIRTRGFAR